MGPIIAVKGLKPATVNRRLETLRRFCKFRTVVLPQTAYYYYAGGANDELTLRENRAAYERITLLPRMLVDVSVRHPFVLN